MYPIAEFMEVDLVTAPCSRKRLRTWAHAQIVCTQYTTTTRAHVRARIYIRAYAL